MGIEETSNSGLMSKRIRILGSSDVLESSIAYEQEQTFFIAIFLSLMNISCLCLIFLSHRSKPWITCHEPHFSGDAVISISLFVYSQLRRLKS